MLFWFSLSKKALKNNLNLYGLQNQPRGNRCFLLFRFNSSTFVKSKIFLFFRRQTWIFLFNFTEEFSAHTANKNSASEQAAEKSKWQPYKLYEKLNHFMVSCAVWVEILGSTTVTGNSSQIRHATTRNCMTKHCLVRKCILGQKRF